MTLSDESGSRYNCFLFLAFKSYIQIDLGELDIDKKNEKKIFMKNLEKPVFGQTLSEVYLPRKIPMTVKRRIKCVRQAKSF